MGFIGAQETIASYGGALRVSRSGSFTAVVATVPVVTGESWLYDPAKENPGRVLSIDDDSTFHFVLEHRMPSTQFEKLTAFPVGHDLRGAGYDRVFVDYDLGATSTGLEYIIGSGLKSEACLVSGMIALDRDLYRKVREERVRAIPKEYFGQ